MSDTEKIREWAENEHLKHKEDAWKFTAKRILVLILVVLGVFAFLGWYFNL